jgi:hypothetical protein
VILEDKPQDKAEDGASDGTHTADNPILIVQSLIMGEAPEDSRSYDKGVKQIAQSFLNQYKFVHNIGYIQRGKDTDYFRNLVGFVV